jgi:hypothetical protein
MRGHCDQQKKRREKARVRKNKVGACVSETAGLQIKMHDGQQENLL